MKMKEGSSGSQTREAIREFISQRKLIGIGDPEYTTGSGTFQNGIQVGDIIVLRQPHALLKIISSPMEYQSDSNFPDFDWLCIVRQVEILSWLEDDQNKNKETLPYFNARGYMATCQEITEPNNLNIVQTWYRIIQESKMGQKMSNHLSKTCNLVLTGAPGTGKTFLAWQIASAMTGDTNPMEKGNEQKEHPHIGFCQFHPSMDYTDFVEGLRPMMLDKKVEQNEANKEAEQSKVDKETKQIGFELRDGIFKEFCRNALKVSEEQPFVFIIDEINRGDISKIFGELFFAIDPDYRGTKGQIKTQYNNLIEKGDVFKDGFYVPENVYIIGTMNDIDRSVESMDFAMRRRFAWQEVTAEESYANMIENDSEFAIVKDEIKARMFNLNKTIAETEGLDEAYQIGAAYFRKYLDYQDKDNPFDCLWKNHLKGLLFEYLRGNRRAKELLEKLHEAYNKTSIDE